MTKKDYILIARAIKNAREKVKNSKYYEIIKPDVAIDEVINLLCYELYGNNSKFDTKKFENACDYRK